MEESEWFKKKVPNGKRKTIYIPVHIAKSLELRNNDKVAVEIKSNGKKIIFPERINVTMTRTGLSYRFDIPNNFHSLNSKQVWIKLIKLEYIFSRSKSKFNKNLELSQFSRDFNGFSVTNWINSNHIVIWHESGNKPSRMPLIVAKNVNVTDCLAKYSGLYFAEGNKQQYFRTYATTKELGRLSIKCYDKIIKNPNLTIYVNFDRSFRDIRKDKKIKKILYDYWKDVVFPYEISKIYITNRRCKTLKDSKKRLKFGTLVLKDGRIMPRLIHNWIVQRIIRMGKSNKNILEKFFEGVVLGDGGIVIRRGRKRQALHYLEIGTNLKEVKVIEEICKILKLKYEKQIRKGKDVRIRIRSYCNMVLLLRNKFLEEDSRQRDKLIYGLKNRVETYILQVLLNNSDNSILFKGEFAKRSKSYLVVNKGELLNNLISFDGKTVKLTQNGQKFINYLKELKII